MTKFVIFVESMKFLFWHSSKVIHPSKSWHDVFWFVALSAWGDQTTNICWHFKSNKVSHSLESILWFWSSPKSTILACFTGDPSKQIKNCFSVFHASLAWEEHNNIIGSYFPIKEVPNSEWQNLWFWSSPQNFYFGTHQRWSTRAKSWHDMFWFAALSAWGDQTTNIC